MTPCLLSHSGKVHPRSGDTDVGRLGSGRGSQDAGTEVLVPQSAQQELVLCVKVQIIRAMNQGLQNGLI